MTAHDAHALTLAAYAHRHGLPLPPAVRVVVTALVRRTRRRRSA